jgi:PAS domain S-box-containing protein
LSIALTGVIAHYCWYPYQEGSMLQMLREQVQSQFTAAVPTRRSWIGLVTLTIALGVAYFLVARLSLLLLAKVGAVIVWPAAGISAGVLIALGRDARWPVAVATGTGTIAASLMNGRPAWISIIFSLCCAGEVLLIAWLIEHNFGRYFSLGRLRHVLGFLAAVVVGAGVTTGGATLAKVIENSNRPIWITWEQWFFGDLGGLIAVSPFLIGLIAALKSPPSPGELIEGVASVVAIGVTTGMIILLLPESWWEMCLLVAALFPLLLWPAARCRPVFALAAAFAVCMIVVSAVVFDIGHFSNQPIDELAMNAHITIIGVAFCALILASLFAERAENSKRLQQALSAGSVLAFEWDADTDVSQRSDNAAQVLGLDQQPLPTGASFFERINPDDRTHLMALLNGLHRDNPSYSTTYRFTRPDGREIWFKDTGKAEFDGAGRLVRLTGLGVDITELKQAEKRQDLLVAELDHRVKNILAQVAVVAASTRQGSHSIDEFLQSLNGRIQSMAAAHTLLGKSGWQSVGLDALVRNQLAPYATDTNITISGTDIMLTAAKVQAVARVLHELVTNAAKYGALSTPGGHVSVNWDRKPNGEGTNLSIVWQEVNGPTVKSVAQSSYGTDLIRNLIPHELGGKVDLMFASEGVSCRIEIPIRQA